MVSKIFSVPLNNTLAPPKENTGKLFFERISTFDKDAIAFVEIMTGETCTFGDLISSSLSLAASLRDKLGIVKNDHLCIIAGNSYKYMVAGLSALYVAAPAHLLNPNYTIYELKKFLFMSKPKLIFCSEQVLSRLTELRLECPFIEFIVVLDDVETTGDILLYKDLINTKVGDFEFEKIDIDKQVAIVVNSSGTTGPPKAVMLSHATFHVNLIHAEDEELYPFYEDQAVIHILPLFHVYGFTIAFCGLYLGIKFLTMNHFVPKVYLESILKYKVTRLCIVPTLADFFAHNALVDQYDLSSIKEIFSAAGVIKETTSDKILQKFNITTIRQIYSMSEIGCAVFISPVSSNKPGSCGKVTPGTSVKIVDPHTGEALGCHQQGEIFIKTAHMIGYMNDPESTQAAFDSDGFVKSGDVAYYDEDYYFYIVDRTKDLIKYKSFQVPPSEIEEILMNHPGVDDVAVVGKPDDRYGEVAVAFVVKNKDVEVTEKDVVDFLAQFVCLEKQLHGGVLFVENIPRNAVGKILRKDLRKLL